jgi:hypothetical protein
MIIERFSNAEATREPNLHEFPAIIIWRPRRQMIHYQKVHPR